MAGRVADILDRNYGRLLAAVVALGLALAAGTFLDLRAADPTFDRPILDAVVYRDWAHRIAGGDLLGREVFFLNPLYAYFLAPIAGLAGDHDLLLIRAVQVLLGLGTVLLVAGATRRVAGPGTALLAALLTAAWPLLLYYQQLLMSATLGVFLNALALWLLTRFADRPTVRAAFLAGLPIGLGLILRPNVALFLLPLPAWFAAMGPAGGRLRFAAARTSALFLAAALPVAPVALRNYAVSGDFVPITWSGGPNLWQCNNPEGFAKGTMASKEFRFNPYLMPHDAIRRAEEAEGRELRPSEVSRYWTRRAVSAMATEPGRAAAHLARKALLFLSGEETPSSYSFADDRRATVLLRRIPLSFGLAAPLALIGACLATGRRRHAAPWVLLAAAYFAGLTLFYPLEHYRAPALPAVLPLAALGVAAIAGLAAAGRWRGLAGAALLLLCFAALSHAAALARSVGIEGLDIRTGADPLRDVNRGYSALGARRLDEAERCFMRAARADPKSVLPLSGLAATAQARGDLAREQALLRQAVALDPSDPKARGSLCRSLALAGRAAEAVAEGEEAVRLDPRDGELRYHLGFALRKAGRPEEARAEMARACDLGHESADLCANLSSLCRELRRHAEALEWIERGLALKPGDGALRLERALTHLDAATGDPESIREDLRAARKAGFTFLPDLKEGR